MALKICRLAHGTQQYPPNESTSLVSLVLLTELCQLHTVLLPQLSSHDMHHEWHKSDSGVRTQD